MPTLNPIQSALHRAGQFGFRSWARMRYAEEISAVERFCLFVGYPRSGHSIVGSLINAHRHAVIAHELNAPELILRGCTRQELFTSVLGRAAWFALRGNKGVYPFQVPNQWQGRFEELRLLGDKRGGAVTRCIEEHSDFLDRTRELAALPLRLIHVVRNPYDNIAAISIRQEMSVPEAADFYFRHVRVTDELDQALPPDEWLTFRHEDLIARPRPSIEALCRFLDLDTPADYLDDCTSIVFDSPTRTRDQVDWSADVLREVEARIKDVPFLGGYSLDPRVA